MAQPKLGPEERAAFAETFYREKIRPNFDRSRHRQVRHH